MASSQSPNIENLRNQAKSLLRAWQQHEPEARNRINEFFADDTRIGLQSTQYVVAREYGFSSWSALIEYVPRMGFFDDIATFHIARRFEVSAKRLWGAISQPDEISVWLLPVSFESRLGAQYAFRSQPEMTGTLGAFSHQKAIRFDSGEDAFWLFSMESPSSASTCLELTVVDHMTLKSVENFPGGAIQVWNPGVTAGWHEILDALEHHLTGRQPPGIDYSRLCKFFERLLGQMIG